MSGVVRGFPAATYAMHASAQTLVQPCSSKKLLVSELDTHASAPPLSRGFVDEHKSDGRKSYSTHQESSSMKGIGKHSVLLLYTLTFFSLLCAASVLATDSDGVSIIGIVKAVDWDDKGNVIAAEMYGTGEEYQIVDNAAGKELLKLDGIKVKAMGWVTEDSKGKKSLTVTGYELVYK